MPRLRRVSADSPGWTRLRSGRGFRYLDEHRRPLTSEQVERVRALVIPPAWREVWICPLPQGHLQATGVDAAGRRQYLYHPHWRELRDRAKFDRVARAALLLPAVRQQVDADLAGAGMTLQRAAATAVRLLDLGCFRIGNDCYADANGSFGLTTLLRRHVRGQGGGLAFRFVGKSGVEHRLAIEDAAVIDALQVMRRRHGGDRLLAYRHGAGWVDLNSALVNSYLAELFGGEFTAKDFRTWHGTVLFAATLAGSPRTGLSATAVKRLVRTAVGEVATYLGNTPAVARSSYIDPRVLDRYRAGESIALAVAATYLTPEERRDALELAVHGLLGTQPAG